MIQYGSEKEALGTAWAIAKSISKKGTSNYVPNAPDVFEEAIGLHMSKFNGEINQRIVKITAEKVEKILHQMTWDCKNIITRRLRYDTSYLRHFYKKVV